jgi:hypothetical protein
LRDAAGDFRRHRPTTPLGSRIWRDVVAVMVLCAKAGVNPRGSADLVWRLELVRLHRHHTNLVVDPANAVSVTCPS